MSLSSHELCVCINWNAKHILNNLYRYVHALRYSISKIIYYAMINDPFWPVGSELMSVYIYLDQLKLVFSWYRLLFRYLFVSFFFFILLLVFMCTSIDWNPNINIYTYLLVSDCLIGTCCLVKWYGKRMWLIKMVDLYFKCLVKEAPFCVKEAASRRSHDDG